MDRHPTQEAELINRSPQQRSAVNASSSSSTTINSPSSSNSSPQQNNLKQTFFTDNIFLFVPNLIGYGRVITAIMSFYYMPFDYPKAVFWYLLSGLADVADGHAARYLNQCSRVGALLDMLTDRCATMCLLIILARFYPRWTFALQLICAIDISSHWMHMYATMLTGRTSHKAVDLASHPVLRIYYSSRPVLFFMCAGNELFFTMLYLCHFTKGPALFGVGLFQAICCICAPVAMVKLAISIVQLVAALRNVAQVDREERVQQQQQAATSMTTTAATTTTRVGGVRRREE